MEEELRRDKHLDTAAAQKNQHSHQHQHLQQQNAFDEQPVGGGGGDAAANNVKNNLFRAPSPILDLNQRNPNMFKAPTSPIEMEEDANNVFRPPSSPLLPAQRKNTVFQASSPVLERDQGVSSRNKQHLFDANSSSSPPSQGFHQQETQQELPGSRQSSHHAGAQSKPASPLRHQGRKHSAVSLQALDYVNDVTDTDCASLLCVVCCWSLVIDCLLPAGTKNGAGPESSDHYGPQERDCQCQG